MRRQYGVVFCYYDAFVCICHRPSSPTCMLSLCHYHAVTIPLPCYHNVITMLFPCCYHAITMLLPCKGSYVMYGCSYLRLSSLTSVVLLCCYNAVTMQTHDVFGCIYCRPSPLTSVFTGASIHSDQSLWSLHTSSTR